MPKLIPAIETWLASEEAAIKASLEADWAIVEPQIIALGRTVESQVLTAAQTYLTSGGNFADALGSLVAQIPGDVQTLEGVIAGLLGTKIAALQAAATATPAATGTAAAS